MNGVYHGLLVLDKPGGMTSRDVVDRAQRWFPARTRIGHTGTLDPLATGVLVLCVGSATRLAEYVQRMAKTYEVQVRLGARSDTDDADGHIEECKRPPPGRESVNKRLTEFIGMIEQVPPVYSAAKITGRRAYDLARQGREVNLKPRPVQIYAIDLLGFEYPRLDLRVRCGKGTYIRSLARDLGERLGCGAYVETLRRTRIGPFDTSQAVRLEADEGAARSGLMPVAAAVAELPHVQLVDSALTRLRQGQGVHDPALQNEIAGSTVAEVAVFDSANNLACIARLGAAGVLVPLKVLN